MAKIGIFGGSFNPPHRGHILAVEEFQRKLSLDRVLLIPAAIPPHKSLTSNSPCGEDRLEMTRLAVKHLPWAEVLNLELQRKGPSYTADTVEQLRKEYPTDELYLLMGTDMFFSFGKWYEPHRITKEACLVVAHRSADDMARIEAQGQQLAGELSAKILYLRNEYLDQSSTSVRAMIAFGCGEEYLSGEVAQYIKDKGLYYSGRNLKALPFEELSAVSLSLHHPKRVAHVQGCSQTAGELARQFGANETDALRAGILHDVTKILTGEEQLKLCQKYGMMITDLERETPKLLHAKTGAAVARYIFGENDAVFEAICWHTTGKANMSMLEKIIYLADYVEPNRDFEGVLPLRELAYRDLDEAMCLGLQMTVDQLRSRKLKINENSLAALRFLQERKSI